MKTTIITLTLGLLVQCAPIFYGRLEPGQLKGSILVQWTDKDAFFFRPDPLDPLQFTRKNGETIVPQLMRTDGGSIPRPLRALKNYSPWGYAPAFTIHDWIFWMHYCKLPGAEKYDVDSAAQIMAEAIKTQMEKDKEIDRFTVYAMYEAVKSPLAHQAWNQGKCNPVPDRGQKILILEGIQEPVHVLNEYRVSL